MSMKYALPTLFTALGLFLVTPTVEAVILYELTTEFSGGTPPSGNPNIEPWATVSISNGVSGSVNVTFNTDGLNASEFITQWNLNYTGDASLLSASKVGWGPSASFSASNNAFKADGDNGRYDIEFNFPSGPPHKRLSKDTSVTYNLTSSGGNIDETFFAATNSPSTKGGPYHTAAHVQGIKKGYYDRSGWIADSGDVTVPEPSTYLMLGTLLSFIAFLKIRKKFNQNSH